MVTLAPAAQFELLAAAAHVKVRRLQPGAPLRLFDGESGGEWPAEVLAIGRSAVSGRHRRPALRRCRPRRPSCRCP
ncbi:MAG: RNA methyltransferase PUA domain-containing protein [Rubrivivax sp.]